MKATGFVVARNDLRLCRLVEMRRPDTDALSEWGPGGVDTRFRRVVGLRASLAGRIPPDQGHMLSLTA